MRRFTTIIPFATLALAGCVSGTPAEAGSPVATTGTVEASATANLFTPQTQTIAQGGTITWSFGTRPHNVTFVQITGVPTNIPTTTSNQVARRFDAPGTYAYACTLHAGMIGTVVVK